MCILCGVLFGFPLGKVLSLVFLSNFWLVASTREMQDIFPNLDAPLREYVLMKKYIIKRNYLFLSFSEPVTQILFCLFYPQMMYCSEYTKSKGCQHALLLGSNVQFMDPAPVWHVSAHFYDRVTEK